MRTPCRRGTVGIVAKGKRQHFADISHLLRLLDAIDAIDRRQKEGRGRCSEMKLCMNWRHKSL